MKGKVIVLSVFTSISMKKLEGKELYRRLQEARNFEKMYLAAIQREKNLEKKIVNLELESTELKKMASQQKELIEKQALLIEELQKIVFGKAKKNKKDKNHNDKNDRTGSNGTKFPKQERSASSYKRPIPEHVTDTKYLSIDVCSKCQTPLLNKRAVERYVQDIFLQEKGRFFNRVEKRIIETGWCKMCKKQRSAEPINGSRVILGPNIKIMTVYLTVVMRLTYEQVKNITRDIYHVKLSDGEIENILEEHANRLIGEINQIKKRLESQPCHYDETGWKTVKGGKGNYGWIATGTKTSTDTIFLLGRSRGKGTAIELRGGNECVGITDDYAAYDNIFKEHALCWAHPNRKLRDLVQSKALTKRKRDACIKTYKKFQALYKEANEFAKITKNVKERLARKEEFMERFDEITQETKFDPTKLKTYKESLRKNRNKYFTFLSHPDVSLDNNEGERKLRHLVLKRKISFGSKTKKGAEIMEKLFSVVLSSWWKDPENFISNYRRLVA